MPVGVKNFPPVRDRIIISIRRFLFPRKGRKQAGKHDYEARFVYMADVLFEEASEILKAPPRTNSPGKK